MSMDKNDAYEPICAELRRIEVPGGWIYESWRYINGVDDWEPYSTVFVPDKFGILGRD